jgi:hypothetical protein
MVPRIGLAEKGGGDLYLGQCGGGEKRGVGGDDGLSLGQDIGAEGGVGDQRGGEGGAIGGIGAGQVLQEQVQREPRALAASSSSPSPGIAFAPPRLEGDRGCAGRST